MKQNLVHIALVIPNYDEAINYYTQKLKFSLIEDTKLSETKRWVMVAPPGSTIGCNILLAEASNDEQKSRIGNQTGGRVFLFLHTDDFDRDFLNLQQHDITVVRQPVVETWGKVAVFQDKFGNLWDLIEPVK